jgi:hypothetical protein
VISPFACGLFMPPGSFGLGIPHAELPIKPEPLRQPGVVTSKRAGEATMPDLVDVLIEAQTDLDWCADPSELERALIRLVDLEPREDVAVPLQQKLAQLRLVAELGRVTQH